MKPEIVKENFKQKKEQRQRMEERKAKRSAKLRNRQPVKKPRKNIPLSVDIIGRTVSFRPTKSSDILFGEVVGVRLDLRKPIDAEYEHTRKYFKVISVELPDGRIMNMSGEHEYLKSIRMIAEDSPE